MYTNKFIFTAKQRRIFSMEAKIALRGIHMVLFKLENHHFLFSDTVFAFSQFHE